MKRLSKEEAESLLMSHYPNFIEAMKKARDSWKEHIAKWPTSSARTRACFINDRIRDSISEKYEEGNIITRRGAFFLRVGDKIAARFKKLNGSRPSNIFTIQANQIEMQQLTLGDSLDAPTIVNVGYVPDKTWNNWRYEISCLVGKTLLWVLDLTPVVEGVVEIKETETLETRKKRVFKKAQ